MNHWVNEANADGEDILISHSDISLPECPELSSRRCVIMHMHASRTRVCLPMCGMACKDGAPVQMPATRLCGFLHTQDKPECAWMTKSWQQRAWDASCVCS